jgi:hypothetical protein
MMPYDSLQRGYWEQTTIPFHSFYSRFSSFLLLLHKHGLFYIRVIPSLTPGGESLSILKKSIRQYEKNEIKLNK